MCETYDAKFAFPSYHIKVLYIYISLHDFGFRKISNLFGLLLMFLSPFMAGDSPGDGVSDPDPGPAGDMTMGLPGPLPLRLEESCCCRLFCGLRIFTVPSLGKFQPSFWPPDLKRSFFQMKKLSRIFFVYESHLRGIIETPQTRAILIHH